jgi:hypothetical protein
VCLPVLMRLWAGKATTSPVELAAQLLALITAAFGDREVHGLGDAAYHAKQVLVAGARWTTRLSANACLFDTAPRALLEQRLRPGPVHPRPDRHPWPAPQLPRNWQWSQWPFA